MLGSLPLEIGIREHGDSGVPIVIAQPDSSAAKAYRDTARNMLAALDQRPKLRGSIGVSLLGS